MEALEAAEDFAPPGKNLLGGSKREVREMAARICREYLSGAWHDVTGTNIGLKRITGGLSNWLYAAWLPEETAPRRGEPRQVLLRLYGNLHGERAMDGLVSESVVFALLAERGLGPRLHGVFPGGRLEELVSARPLQTRELADPKVSSEIARQMAAVHDMEVPLGKSPTWLFDTMSRWLRSALDALASPGRVAPRDVSAVATLQTLDLAAELGWMRERVAEADHDVGFCHNDLQEGNILLRPGYQPEPAAAPQVSQPELVLIDFEYCAYNYVAFDVANHFAEWTYDYTAAAYPHFVVDRTAYPSRQQQMHFAKAYLAARGIQREPAQLLEEVKTFALASHLLYGLWGVVNARLSDIPFGYWEYARERLEAYLALKKLAAPSS